MRRRGLLLFSGGIDSTLSALLLKETTELVALTVTYPGRPEGEKLAASQLIGELRLDEHVDIALDIPLTPISLGRTLGWVPYRNLVIWSLAAYEAVRLMLLSLRPDIPLKMLQYIQTPQPSSLNDSAKYLSLLATQMCPRLTSCYR